MYRVGLALLDLDEPTRVLRRLPSWVLAPLAAYERTGDVPNVVFPCGLIHDPASGDVRLYYGAADSSICLATARLDELLDAVLAAPPGRLSRTTQRRAGLCDNADARRPCADAAEAPSSSSSTATPGLSASGRDAMPPGRQNPEPSGRGASRMTETETEIVQQDR